MMSMQVEPTCRFCQQKMISSGAVVDDYTKPTEYIAAWLYLCKRCHSEQAFEANGRIVWYDFSVGAYYLLFNPKQRTFEITLYPNGRLRPGTSLLKINACPTHLTPQNTPLERVKLLILFS